VVDKAQLGNTFFEKTTTNGKTRLRALRREESEGQGYVQDSFNQSQNISLDSNNQIKEKGKGTAIASMLK